MLNYLYFPPGRNSYAKKKMREGKICEVCWNKTKGQFRIGVAIVCGECFHRYEKNPEKFADRPEQVSQSHEI